MCGIAGLLQRGGGPVRGGLVTTVQERMRHRGPDDEGWLTFLAGDLRTGRRWTGADTRAEAVLLHRRLSILDLSEAGWQPMSSPDGRYHIVYNGEIYNFLELRSELEGLGHVFRSHSDTEVLIAAYAEWGAGAFARFIGMFALALLDTQRRTVILARDFFGIKPLYYARLRDGFAFASEVKVLLEFPGVSRRANARQVLNYLSYELSDGGDATMLEGVSQLPAAHYLEIPLDDPAKSVAPVRFWQLDRSVTTDLSFDEAANRLRDLFLDSVRLHLRSDVAVGAALSGGVDSSAIVCAMRAVGGKALDIHTFSYIAADKALSEERWVDLVAEATGATVHKIFAGPDDLRVDIDRLVDTQDEPFGGTSIYAQHRVFRAAHEAGIKVMLDGQGADEMLGGYRYYVAARFASLVGRGRVDQALSLRRAAADWAATDNLWRESLQYLIDPDLRTSLRRLLGRADRAAPWLNAKWFLDRGVELRPPVGRYGRNRLRDELHRSLTVTSLPALLRYEDRNSMAYSVESRVPFLTPQLAQFIASLPEEYIIAPDGTTKAVFRRAMRGVVPDAILDRRDKIGFATPEKDWMRTIHPWANAVLGNGHPLVPALAREQVGAEWKGVLAGERPFDSRLWRMLNMELWARRVGVSFD